MHSILQSISSGSQCAHIWHSSFENPFFSVWSTLGIHFILFRINKFSLLLLAFGWTFSYSTQTYTNIHTHAHAHAHFDTYAHNLSHFLPLFRFSKMFFCFSFDDTNTRAYHRTFNTFTVTYTSHKITFPLLEFKFSIYWFWHINMRWQHIKIWREKTLLKTSKSHTRNFHQSILSGLLFIRVYFGFSLEKLFSYVQSDVRRIICIYFV